MRTILLVDDDQSFAYSAAKAISEAGFKVVMAHEFSEALRVLENDRIDILLVDIRMPGQPHGFALARMARRRVPTLPIVYVTSYPEMTEPERETALGQIVLKSKGMEVLIGEIRDAIRSGPQREERP